MNRKKALIIILITIAVGICLYLFNNNFKRKFDNNLLYYFNLNESEDCGSMCSLNRKDKEIIVEVYGNFKNTESTYWTTHHFHYTLDDE